MQVNTGKALNAWMDGRAARPAPSIWTDGQTIYSYNTAIVTRGDGGTIIFNATKYSRTTSKHQNALLAVLRPDVVEVAGQPIGVWGYRLEDAAAEQGREDTAPAKPYDVVGAIMAYESGDMEDVEDMLALFQNLVDTGLAWSLQGSYGRMAATLLGQGHITERR